MFFLFMVRMTGYMVNVFSSLCEETHASFSDSVYLPPENTNYFIQMSFLAV